MLKGNDYWGYVVELIGVIRVLGYIGYGCWGYVVLLIGGCKGDGLHWLQLQGWGGHLLRGHMGQMFIVDYKGDELEVIILKRVRIYMGQMLHCGL